MSEDIDVPTLSGWYNRTSWKSFGDVCTNPFVHMSQERQLTPGFDIARCCGRRKMKYLIRRWVSMKGKRIWIRVRWRQRGRAGHSVIPSSSYLPTLKCDIPTF